MTRLGVFLICFLFGLFCLGRLFALPVDAIESHRYADGVLGPRFFAAMNDFVYQHPHDSKPGAWDHVHTLNAGDLQRYRAVRSAFREMDEAMKRAGY